MSFSRYASCGLLLATLPACELVSGLNDLAVDESFGGAGSTLGGSGGAGATGTGATGTGATGAGGTGGTNGGGDGGLGGTGGTVIPCSPGAAGEPCCNDGVRAQCEANRICGPGNTCRACIDGLEAGGQHVCLTRSDDTIWCFGLNLSGELGFSPNGANPTPVQITGLASDTVKLDAGSATCAQLNLGTLYCWGDNSSGQVGDGTSVSDHPTLGFVSDLGNTTTAFGQMGGHACAQTIFGLHCWGDNSDGALGINLGDGMTYNTPQEVTAITDTMIAFSGGFDHTCALSDQGAVLCWGRGDDGQLGHPPNWQFLSYAPDHPAGLDAGVTAIAGASNHHCAIKTDKTLWCWGNNLHGELGDPVFGGTSRVTPTQVVEMGTETEYVSAAGGATCAVKTDGSVWCWGDNNEGELGRGFTSLQHYPLAEQVPLPAPALAVELSYRSACAHLVDGRVFCWGRNLFGQSGVGSDPMLTPNEIPLACP